LTEQGYEKFAHVFAQSASMQLERVQKFAAVPISCEPAAWVQGFQQGKTQNLPLERFHVSCGQPVPVQRIKTLSA
jgi:hypothetical protein